MKILPSALSFVGLLLISATTRPLFLKSGGGHPFLAEAQCDSVNTTLSISITDTTKSIRLVSDTDGVSYSSSSSATSYLCTSCSWTVTCPSNFNPIAYEVNTATAPTHILYVKDGSTVLGSWSNYNTRKFSNQSSSTSLTVEFNPSGSYCSTTSSFWRSYRRGWTVDIACLPSTVTNCDRDLVSSSLTNGTVYNGATDTWTYAKLSSSSENWLNAFWRAGQHCQYTFGCSSGTERLAVQVLATPVAGMTQSTETSSAIEFGTSFSTPFSSLEPWGTGVVESTAGTSLQLALSTSSSQGSSGRELTIGYICLTGGGAVGSSCASPNRTSTVSNDIGSLTSDPDGHGTTYGVLYQETCSWTISCATSTKQMIMSLQGDAGYDTDSYVKILRSDSVQYVWNEATRSQSFMVTPGLTAAIEFKNMPSSSVPWRVGSGWTLSWECVDPASHSDTCPSGLAGSSPAISIPDTETTVLSTDADGGTSYWSTTNGINCTYTLSCQDSSKKYMIVEASGYGGLNNKLTLTPSAGSAPTISSASSARYTLESIAATLSYNTVSLSDTSSTSSRTAIDYGATVTAVCSNTNCLATSTPDGAVAATATGGTIKTDSDGVGSTSRNSGQQTCEWTVTCPFTQPFMSLNFDISLNSNIDFSLKLPNGSSIYERNQTSYSSRTESRKNFFRLAQCSSSSSFYRRSCGDVATGRTTVIKYDQRLTNTANGATVGYKCWPQSCAWSSNIDDYTIRGSTSASRYFANYNTSTSDQFIGETCSWILECPAGSWVGATNLGFHMRSGMQLRFYNVTTNEGLLSTWSTDQTGSTISSGSVYSGRQWLAPYARKVRVDFSRGTSSSQGYGFRLSFKCFTSQCPSEFKPALTVFNSDSRINVNGVANYGSNTSRGFFFKESVVPGINCSNLATFACPDPDDRLVGWYQLARGRDTVVELTAPTFRASRTMQNSYNTQSRAIFNLGRAVGTDNISISIFRNNYGASGQTDYQDATMQVFCQPAIGERCYSPTRAGIVHPQDGLALNLWSDPDGNSGNYLVADHDQNCTWNVSCPPGTSEVVYTGREGRSWSSYTTAQVFTSTSRYAVKSFTSSSGTYTYTGTGNTSLIYQHIRSSDANVYGFTGSVQCLTRTCGSSPNKTLSVTDGGSTLIVPSNGSWSLFMSDRDGAGTTFSASSFYTLEGCSYDLQCPSGTFLQLNVSGRFSTRTSQRVLITANTPSSSSLETPSYSYTGSSSLTTVSTPQSLLTGLSGGRLTIQHQYYSSTYNRGVTVAATCTRVQRGSCPVSSNYFSQLATGSRSSMRLDFERTQPFPVGYECSWSLRCPAGQVLASSTSSSARPIIRLSGSTRSYSYIPSGFEALTMTWSSGASWTSSGNRGLDITVRCVDGPPPTPAPTAPALSASNNTAGSCPYKKAIWDLDGAKRQRIVLRFPYSSSVKTCRMVFRCPANYESMAVKMVLSRSRSLTIYTNASNDLSSVDLNGANPVKQILSSTSTRDKEAIITPGSLYLRISSVRRTSLTKLGLLMTCLKVAVPVPERVNYLDGSTTRSSTTTVTSTSFKSYSHTQYAVPRRRQYAANTNKAFLISCPSVDIENDYERVSLSRVAGVTSEGDLLTITNLDNQQSQTFSGSLSRSFTTSSSDKDSETVFHVSSQFYVNWAADSESISSEDDVTITYRCNSADFTVSGSGAAVESDYGSSSSDSTSLESTSSSGTSTGMIVGIVFGAIGFIMIMGCLIAACCRGSQQRQRGLHGMATVAEPTTKLPPTATLGGIAFATNENQNSNPVQQFANTWGTTNSSNVEMNIVTPQPAAQAAPAYPEPPAYSAPPSYPSGSVQSTAWGNHASADPWSTNTGSAWGTNAV